ncbi:DNA helicase [Chryseobacterium elymi]|uniref:DNA helicase n=1 Tax=Chryseobacterium elymi TaxID=395936 RepID=A0A3D9DQD0_9FLAO|nr:DEAD/DEAH box helicase [Chryseobacterium elymi]REC80096.1 DNA helicase [Chryseobacterium elymi]
MSKITSVEKRQLTTLKNNAEFTSCFKKLIFNNKLTFEEAQYILTVALIFFRYYNNDKRLKGYFNIAYYIVLKYGLVNDDYRPLYDISLQIGFYPISEFILANNLLHEEYLHESIINQEIRTLYNNSSYIETVEQYNTSKEILERISLEDSSYIAPTSFGKSSIIREVIKQNDFSKIAIIVPTKSLITQTYIDIRNLELNYKLILHDEMFNGEERFIGILTQERATRLINKFNVKFDILFIDEAHNILRNNSRNHLLSRLIMLNYKNNPNQRLLYLSPLVNNSQNLKAKFTSEGQIFQSSIKHNLKAYDVFYLDKRGVLSIFDRFSNESYELDKNSSFINYIITNTQEKNFIYNYRPKNVELIAKKLSLLLENIENETLVNISRTIASEISEDIDLVTLVRKGIIYLHGKQPTILKEYLEYQYKDILNLKFIIANSVILEGINFPIDTLFITSTYGLNVKDLNNLIGRVNRLNYVFQSSLSKLVSKIHFVDSEEFTDKVSNMRNKLSLLREHTFKDENKNPLLEGYNVEELKLTKDELIKQKEKDNKLISFTEFLINENDGSLENRIKHSFIENNIDDFYWDIESAIPLIIKNFENISDKSNVISTIYEVFIMNIENQIKDYEIERLKNEKARNYYKNYIDIIQLLSLKDKIINTLNYFEAKAKDINDSHLFIGRSFGEVINPSPKYKNYEYLQEVYINLRGKSRQQLANISLVKIKLEEDFVSFKLKKLITFLYDFELITKEAYFLAVYGTVNEEVINLTRIGLGPSVTKMLKENNQIENISFDQNGNLTSNDAFKIFLANQSELFKFEINKYIK